MAPARPPQGAGRAHRRCVACARHTRALGEPAADTFREGCLGARARVRVARVGPYPTLSLT